MSSTNKTPNYELSQFVSSDKPAWLTDINQDMSKIDTAIKTASDTATGADGKADSNATKIGNLENLTTSTKSSLVSAINEVDGNADNATAVATTASNTANSANSKVNDLSSYFSLKNNKTLTCTATVSAGSITIYEQKFRSTHNDDGTLGKIYGHISTGLAGTLTSGTTLTIEISDTGLRPTANFSVESGAITNTFNNTGVSTINTGSVLIRTNGTVRIQTTIPAGDYGAQITMQPYLIFAQDFGD